MKTSFPRSQLFLLFLFLFASQGLIAQSTYADTLNCWGGTPTYVVDLSSDPDSLWVSSPSERAGSCCTPPDDNCVQFALTLSPDAIGLNFYIPGGADGCGASPSGSLFYQVDCGPLTSVGTPLCLDGPGPYVITFCKPGSNENCYAIQSISAPGTSEDIVIGDGCTGTLEVEGLFDSTITWTSVAPGTVGDWDGYLGCPACPTTTVTPDIDAPGSIFYQVCGTSIGGCVVDPWCDTVEVQVVPDLDVNIAPDDPSICFGEAGVELTAIPDGGAAPYTYLWSTGEVTNTIFVTGPGTYFVEISDSTDCPVAYDTVVVTEYLEPITADAGPDLTICQSDGMTIDLNGTLTGSTTGEWSGGGGTYDSDITDMTLTYTPSASELLAGVVELILTTTDNGTCPGDTDTVLVNLATFESTMDTSITNVDCFGNSNGAIDLSVAGGASPFTFAWSDGSITEDVSGLSEGTYTVYVTDANGCTDSVISTITEPDLLTETISGINPLCFGDLTGAVDLEISGGTPPYSYVWSSGEVTEDLTGVGAGSYTVTVTDANGCTVGSSIDITQPAELTGSTIISNVSCNGGTDGSVDISVIGGVGPYSYSWTTGSVTEDISGVGAGSYSVIVTDANGCNLSLSSDILEPEELILSVIGSDVSCFGYMDGSADLTVSGGTLPYVYNWSSGESTEDISDLFAGEYSVTVTDANGCLGSTDVSVLEPPELSASLTTTDVPCNGGTSGSIDLTVTGGTGDYDYSWSTGAITEDLLELPSGTYTVDVTDINDCAASAEGTISEPEPINVSAEFTHPLCPESEDGGIDITVSGGTPPYTFNWSTGVTTEDLNEVGEGTYNVDIMDANGCLVNAEGSLIDPEDYTAGEDTIYAVCNDEGTIDLNLLLSSTYGGDWSELTSSGQFNSVTGQLDVTGLSGEFMFNYDIPSFTPCTDSSALITIVINPIPIISFEADRLSGCAPLAVNFSNLTVPEGMDCAWDFGDGSGAVDCGTVPHVYEYPGTYTVSLEVVTDKGCSNYFEIEDYIHVSDSPEASFFYKPDVPNVDDPFVDFTNTTEGATSYLWDFGDGSPNSTQENPSHLFPDEANAEYTVTLIAQNDLGCTDTAVKIIQVEDVLLFFVPNVFTPDGDDYNESFKPVMTAGYDIYDYHLSIFDRWGELVFESYNSDYGWDGTYSNNGLVQDGVYVWVLDFGETMSDKRHIRRGHVTVLK